MYVYHGFPLSTITFRESRSPLPLISYKSKRDLWKPLNVKESCLSHNVSYKSGEVHIASPVHLSLELESYAEDSENPRPHLRTDHSSAAHCCHQLYCSHSKAFYPTRSFFLEGDNPSQRSYQTLPSKMSNLPHMQVLYCYFLTSLECLAAINTETILGTMWD